MTAALALLAVMAVRGGVEARLTACDAAWERRAEGAVGAVASVRGSDAMIGACRAALTKAPDSPEAVWRLQRALFFRSAFTGAPDAQRATLLAEARDIGEAAIARLEAAVTPGQRLESLGRQPAAAAVYFWSAVGWGEWAQVHGKLAAARSGAASRVRELARTVVDLDPVYEEGGGWRILGRLHAEAPRIPLITGWVSRDEAVRDLERSARIGPDNAVTRVFLADALLAHAPARKTEAVRLLRLAVSTPPRPEYLVEEAHWAEQARQRLVDLGIAVEPAKR